MDIERLLQEGKTIQFKPDGWSMYPLLHNGRDAAIVEPLGDQRPKKYDVVLYRRKAGILVLHRVCKIRKDGIYLIGDHQTEIEGPLEDAQMRGVMVAFVRNGKTVPVNNIWYLMYVRIWLWLRPLRPFIGKVVHAIKEKVRKGK